MHRPTITFLALAFAAYTSAQQPGDLDITFDGDGWLTTDFGLNDGDHGSCMAVQPDGRIVVAGSSQQGSAFVFALARYLPDGALDNTFGTGGRVTTPIDAFEDQIHAIALQPDGKIVVGGVSWGNGQGYQFAVARYNTNGTLDNSFSSGGMRVDDIGAGTEDAIYSLAVQQDGAIVAVGTAHNGTDKDIVLVRYTTSGALDNTFGTGGIVVTDVNASIDEAVAVALQPNGDIIIAGHTGDGTDDEFILARYAPNGTLDPSFGNAGLVITAFGNGADWAYSIALLPDGRILAGGIVSDVGSISMAVAKFNLDGSPDTGFGTNGLTVVPNGFLSTARSLALLPDGRIVAGGTSVTSFTVVLLHADGSLDNGFSGDGIQTTTLGSAAYGNAVAVANGKILLAGQANFGATLNDFVVLRYHTNLSTGINEAITSVGAPEVFPNPMRDHVTLSYTLPRNEEVTIHLLDMQGRVVATFAGQVAKGASEQQCLLELPDHIAPGSYLLSLSTASLGIAYTKVIKE